MALEHQLAGDLSDGVKVLGFDRRRFRYGYLLGRTIDFDGAQEHAGLRRGRRHRPGHVLDHAHVVEKSIHIVSALAVKAGTKDERRPADVRRELVSDVLRVQQVDVR